jgi:hypothetical protein
VPSQGLVTWCGQQKGACGRGGECAADGEEGQAALIKMETETPDFECERGGTKFGVEVITRARPEAAGRRLEARC